MEGLTEGRIVHVRLDGVDHCVAAIVARVFRDADGQPPENGKANLRLFLDGTNDRGYQGDEWATSVEYSDDGESFYTWHWPERA